MLKPQRVIFVACFIYFTSFRLFLPNSLVIILLIEKKLVTESSWYDMLTVYDCLLFYGFRSRIIIQITE